MISSHKEHRTIVVENNYEIYGYISVVVDMNTRISKLSSLYLDPLLMYKGFDIILLQKIKRYCLKMGAYILKVEVELHDMESINFFENEGFIKERESIYKNVSKRICLSKALI
jgi:L-amino acid N-acyltransferase YncA